MTDYIKSIKKAVDILDMDLLYSICCQYPDRFFIYISPRYLGKKRLDKLRVYLRAQKENIPSQHFLEILLSRSENFADDILTF